MTRSHMARTGLASRDGVAAGGAIAGRVAIALMVPVVYKYGVRWLVLPVGSVLCARLPWVMHEHVRYARE